MKKIEDYIHLYLGCEVDYAHGTGGILMSVSKDVCIVYQKPFPSPDGNSDEIEVKPSNLTLLLRPLADMMEEDLEIPNFADGYTLEREQYGDKGNWLIDDKTEFGYTIELYDDGSMNCICKDNGENYPYAGSEITRQLLSKGFDLFGLIEAGLAIDSTTLNK